jgi:hypothetical protein
MAMPLNGLTWMSTLASKVYWQVDAVAKVNGPLSGGSGNDSDFRDITAQSNAVSLLYG